MTKSKYLIGAVALALAAAAPAGAQTIASDLSSHLVVGFYATGGTGSTSALEVDLGAITNYVDGSGNALGGSSMWQVTNFSSTDLSATYGATWNTRSDVYWGVIGTTTRTATGPQGQPIATLWVTNAESTPGTLSTPWTIAGSTTQKSWSSKLENVLSNTASGGLAGATVTANSNFAAVLDSSSATYAFTNADGGSAGTSFSTWSGGNGIDNLTTVSGSNWVVSDLWELRSGTFGNDGTYIGSFGINSSGDLYFATSASAFAAVPEPSTYAAIAGLLALGIVMIRRRLATQVAA